MRLPMPSACGAALLVVGGKAALQVGQRRHDKDGRGKTWVGLGLGLGLGPGLGLGLGRRHDHNG